MLKLKLQYFGHLMWRADSLEKTLVLGKPEAGGEGDDRGWEGWMESPTQWTWTWTNSRRRWGTGKPDVLQSMGSQRTGHDWATEQQPLRWGLWNAIRFRWDSDRGAPRMRLVSLQEETPENSPKLPPRVLSTSFSLTQSSEDTGGKQPCVSQEERVFARTQPGRHTDLRLPASSTVRKQISVL